MYPGAVIPEQPFLKSFSAVGPVRNHDFQVVGEGERAPVKKLVMKRAEGQAVDFRVRPPGLMPFDVGGFQGHRKMVDADIESADCATIFVSPKDSVAKSRVPGAVGGCGRCHVDTDGLENVFVNGVGEVGVQQLLNDFPDDRRLLSEFPENRFREATGDIILKKFCFFGIPAACQMKVFRVSDLPDLIILESPEGIMGIVGFPIRAEFLKKPGQFSIHLFIGNEPIFVPKHTPQSIQGQKRFMRRSFAAAFPEGEIAEFLFQDFRVHGEFSSLIYLHPLLIHRPICFQVK